MWASVFENSSFVTGLGAVTFTGPCIDSVSTRWWSAATTSVRPTQLMGCLPEPSFPPPPSWKGGRRRSSAPPRVESTTPRRGCTVRIPARRAGSAAASHASATSARKSRPCGPGLVERLLGVVGVDPHGGAGDEDARRAGEAGDRAGDEVGALHAAAEDRRLVLARPPLAHRLAGEVDHGVHPLEGGGVDRAAGGVPHHVAGGGLAGSRTTRRTVWPPVVRKG
jgi:hypothetical protein